MEKQRREPDWKKLAENKYLQQKQLQSTGLSNFHHACLVTLQFQDFLKDYSKLKQKVETHPHLKQKYLDSFSSFALETVASKLQEERPNNFHNTFVFFNGDCILQLKNKEKLNELKQQNLKQLEDRMKIVSCDQNDPDQETKLSRLKARMEVPDKEQFWTPETKKDITNTTVTFSKLEPVPYLKHIIYAVGFGLVGLGIMRLYITVKRRRLKKRIGIK